MRTHNTMTHDGAPSGTMFSQRTHLARPKSTPSTLRTKSQTSSPYNTRVAIDNRPKTAVGMTKPECDRVQQVEHEATRKHNLEAHLPLKKPRTPPWQQKLDRSPTPCVVAPGYILSRSKSKIAMYIKTDEFFDPQQDPQKSGHRCDPKRDALVAELQQQIDDLKLFLEEERLNHRETKRKGGDQLRDRLTELENEHENNMRITVEQYEERIEKMQQQHKDILSQQVNAAETSLAKQRGEIEFLHGAFESYKTRLYTEMDEKWKKKEDDLKLQLEERIQQQLHEVKTLLISEHGAEKAQLARDQEREIQRTRREHKKELDSLIRRFSNAAADMERLKETESKLKVVEEEYESMKSQYDLVCTELGDRTHDLTDAKVQLMNFEKSFQDKVKEVDERYKSKIHDLMVQNTQIRRLYVKKCGQLFEEKATSEVARIERVSNVKETMRTVIQARNRANVSMAAVDLSLQFHPKPPKDRPVSAPVTRDEEDGARLSAGETSHSSGLVYQSLNKPYTGKACMLSSVEDVLEDKR